MNLPACTEMCAMFLVVIMICENFKWQFQCLKDLDEMLSPALKLFMQKSIKYTTGTV